MRAPRDRHLVERQTRNIRLLNMRSRDSAALHLALTHRMADLPSTLLRSITWNQGTEMPPASDDHSVAGNAGVLLRCALTVAATRTPTATARIFLEGTDLTIWSADEHLGAVEAEINTPPGLVLEDHTPAAFFAALLASSHRPVLRRRLESSLKLSGIKLNRS